MIKNNNQAITELLGQKGNTTHNIIVNNVININGSKIENSPIICGDNNQF